MKPTLLPIQDLSTRELLRLLCPPGSGEDEAFRHPNAPALLAEFWRRKDKERWERQRPYWLRYARAYFEQFSN